MKIILLIIVFSITIFGCNQSSNSRDKNDLTKQNLKGSVSSITESQYGGLEKFGELEKGPIEHKYFYKYNTDGNMTNDSGYDYDNIPGMTGLNHETVFIYDNKGNLSEKGEDFEVNKISADSVLKDTTIKKAIYKRNNSSNLVISKYDGDNILEGKMIYKFDEKGNEVEISDYNKEGKLEEKTIVTYDNTGNKNQSLSYDKDDKLTLRDTYKCDIKGNQIEVNIESKDTKFLVKRFFEYDDKGNELKEYCNSKEYRINTISYKYEYDKIGNWTKRISTEDAEYGNIETIVERKIEYKLN